MAKISQNKKNVLEYGEKIYKEYVKRNDTKRSQKSGGSLGERIYKEYSAKSASEDLRIYAEEYAKKHAPLAKQQHTKKNSTNQKDLMSYAKEYTQRYAPLTKSLSMNQQNTKNVLLKSYADEMKKRAEEEDEKRRELTETPTNPKYKGKEEFTLATARKNSDFSEYVKKGSRFGYSDDLTGKVRLAKKSLHSHIGLRARHLTDEEKEMYNYILGKYGREEADNFEESISEKTNQRMTDENIKVYQSFSKEHPVLGVGINAGASIGSGKGYLKALADEITNYNLSWDNANPKKDPVVLSNDTKEKLKSGKQIKTDINSEAFLPSAIEEASREGVKEATRETFGDNGTVDFLTDTGLSITQNIARLPFGSVGLAVAAGGAATGGYKDAIERGGTNAQALLSGAAQGGAEATFEKVSLESLKGLQAVPVKVKSDIVKNLLKQGFTEGSEEIFTELANYMSDELIMKERSEYNQNLKAYQEAGYSYDDAVRKANQDLLKQIGLAGAGGALSGGIMGGGAMALGQAQQSTDNKYLNQLIIDPADPTQSGSREDIWRAEFAKEYAKELAQENTKEFAQGNNPQEQPEPAQIRFENEQAEDLQPTKEKTAETARELSKEIFASYGENGSRVATEQYNPELELLDYQRAFNKYYDAGRHNNTMKAAENAPITAILSKEQAQAAYNAGLEDFKLEQSQEFEYKQGEEKKGSFINQAEHSTGAQVKFLEKVGKQTGLKVVLVDDMEGANASYENGTITISANSKNVMGSTSHELTHFMREYAKKDFESYRDMCVNYMMESKNVSLDKLVENYQKSYEKQGQTLTRDEIMEEITADATVEFFNDEAFIERVVKKDRSIGERIMDFLNDIIDAMKELISSETRAASRAIKENMQHYEMLREVWGEALGIASDTYKSGKELVEKQEKKYQLKKPELATEEQIEKNFETVRKMKPVAELTGNEFEGRRGVKSLTEAVTEYYNSLGNVVHNDVVGDIVLSRRSAKDDIAHGYNDLKAVAFKSVPDVLEKGQILNYSKNWKERGYDTAIIGAKVKISSGKNKGDYYQICVAKVSKENRMYLHEVQITKMNGDNPFKTWAAKSGLPSGDAPFIYSIFDKLQGVNDKTTRFQLKEPVEETKDLIAVHNITSDKLLKMLELEGIPMPSIAIAKADLGHEAFGEISLLFDKDTIDPKKKKNKVYSADAWTPTFPQIEYETNSDVKYRMQKKASEARLPEEYSKRVGMLVNSLEDYLQATGSEEGVLDKLKNEISMKALYLTEKGEIVEEISKEVREEKTKNRIYEIVLDTIEETPEQIGKTSLKELYEKYAAKIKTALLNSGVEEERAERVTAKRGMFGFEKTIRRAVDYANKPDLEVKTVTDYDAMRENIEDRVNAKEFEHWLRENLEGLIKDSGIYNEKGRFTASGERKTFKQTHLPLTAKNVLKVMLQENDKNTAGFIAGVKSVRAEVSEEFTSIGEIKKASNRLVTTEEYQTAQSELSDRLEKIMKEIQRRKKVSDNEFMDMDYIGENILEASENPTPENFKSVLTKYGRDVTDKQAQELSELIQDVKEMPVNMFEAKPQRVVDYKEIVAAVIPEGDETVKKALTEKGVNVITYNQDVAGSRKEVVNSVKGIRFQLKETDSDGNTLSDGQKEYFKDSKVRDEKGNLMVMYHGTPNAGFTEFRPGTYFTPNEWYAEFYHDTGASMLKTKQTADNPDTYKVYLNMKKPFDTRLPEVREIWDNDFYMQWGNGTPLMESGLPDWVDGEDILEFIEENELDFDGVILDEGGIYEDGEVKKRGLSYVVMSPEQVKNVTNQNPTENKDIRYQLEEIDESLNTDDIIKENEKLKEANEELRQQLTLTRKYAPRIEDINKYAGEILKTYNSDYSKKALADNLERLYRYMGNEKVNMDEISEVSAILAKNVLNKAHSADLENEEYNKKLLNTIRETKMKIPRELRPDLVIEGGYGVFRQKYFRKLTLSEKGIGIDVAYEQLKTQYPELFPEGIINPIDQLFKIAEVVDEAKPKIENPYKADLDELSVILGQEMLDYRVNIRNRPKTEADKLFERADELEGKWYTSRKLYEEKMKNYKATLKAQEETKSAKKQIIRDVTKMQDWLLRPNDKEHVPEALRVPVAQFLSQIDYSTSYKNQFGEETKRTLSWEAAKSAFESIMSSGCVVEGKYYELDPNLAVNIEKLTEKVKGMNRLDELDHDTIVTLRDTVVSMKKSIVEADLLHGNESYVQAGKAAKQCAEELKTRKDKWTAKGFGRTDELLNVDMLDSFTFFETMGPAAETMLRELRSGFDKKVEYKRATADYFEKLKEENKLTAKQMREWSKDTREFTGENGTIRLTTGELMTLYGLTKRPQARKHIFESGARGIRTRSSEEVREVKVGDKTVMKVKGTGSTKPVQFTANEVSEMVKTLTPEQKNIVDGIMKYFVDYTGKWGNEVSMLMYGYKKFNDQNYFPIEVDRNELAVTTEAQQQTRTMLKNLGMTKSTVKDAKNAIIIDDIFNVFAKHADQMENYAALTPALSDFHKFYNYKDENFNGLKELIEQKLGKEGNSYIQDLLIDVNGGMSKESSPTAAMLRNVKSAAVGANIRTVIQQPTAYMRAMMEIDPKYLALGLKKAPKGAWEECKKYAAIAQWKDWGFFDINTGRSMRSIMMGPETLRESMIEKSMEAAGKGDEIAWTHLWLAVQEETKSIHPDLTGEEFYKYCGRRFSDIIDRTQVVDSIFHRSRAMKKKTLDIYTSFMSEPTKSYNMLYRAADKMKRGNTKEARKYLERAALTYTLTGALTSVAAAVWDAFRDDDDEKGLAEKYKENLLSNLLDNLNPLNLIPFVKDVVSIFSGYALNRMDMQGIQYAKYSLTELQNYIEGTSKFNFAGMMGKWTKPVSMLTGVPASNLIREINTIFDAAFAIGKEAGLEGAHIADYKKDTLTLPLEKEKNLTNYTKKALKAYSEGKRAAGDRILEELKKSGIAQNKIDSKIKIVMKDWPDVEEAAEKFLEGDLEGYESAVNELSEYGIDKELIISSVHSAINKIQKADEESEEEQEEEQEEEKEDEKKEEPILYKGKDIYYALESGNEKNANKMIDHIYKAKRKAGKKASTARGAIKSSLSSQYKKIYLNSGHEERLKIRRKLEKIRVDGQAIFKESDFKNWLEKK